MIKTVISTELPVDEHLLIRKNVFSGGEGKKRICIVTGTHGDELEGQYICYRIGEILRSAPASLEGIVEIWPALNPLGIDSITRGIPNFDLDMNRIFPGDPLGTMAESTAYNIIQDLKGADLSFTQFSNYSETDAKGRAILRAKFPSWEGGAAVVFFGE